jgi:uncharacterized protein (DUF2126 family)
VWHPIKGGFAAPPLTRFEASARRAQRFTRDGGTPWPVHAREAHPDPDNPCTLDLRRFDLDRALPRYYDWPDSFGGELP